MKWLSAVALCLVVTGVSGQAYDDWVYRVEDEYGDTVSINCTNAIDEDNGHPRPDPDGVRGWENATVDYWLVFLDRVDANQSIRGDNVEVSPDGWTLTVKNVTPEYHTIYHCVMKTPQDTVFMVKWGINMRGPYFVDLWDKYEMNVIIGFSAMGGFLVLAFFVLGVYHFRWIDPYQGEKGEITSFDNLAYINGEYNEPKDEDDEFGSYDLETKTPPQDENYGIELTSNPVFTSVAEIHTDSPPVYATAAQNNLAANDSSDREDNFRF